MKNTNQYIATLFPGTEISNGVIAVSSIINIPSIILLGIIIISLLGLVIILG